MKNKVDIVLRTCARTGVVYQTPVPRIVPDDRLTMIRKCIASLVTSINNSSQDVILTVFDDHSDPGDFEKIQALLNKCKAPVQIFKTQTQGFNNSAYEQFLYGR